MNVIQVIRMVEELHQCEERIDKEAVRHHFDYMRARYGETVSSYVRIAPAHGDARSRGDISDDDGKSYVGERASAIVEMCKRSQTFVEQVLEPSGMLSALGSNSLVLAELYDLYPRDFPDQARSEALRISRQANSLPVGNSDLLSHISFFSPVQLRHDLDGALAKTIEQMSKLGDKNTNWLKVGLGVLRVAGGLFSKASGAAACLTGGGCLAGAVGIVAGTDSIISGVRDIASGIEEP